MAEFLGERGLTLSSSVIAEWYASYGFIAVFFGRLLCGIYARIFGALWVFTNYPVGRLLYGVAAMALFAGVRSMIDLVLMSYIVLAWLPLWWFMLKRANKRRQAALARSR